MSFKQILLQVELSVVVAKLALAMDVYFLIHDELNTGDCQLTLGVVDHHFCKSCLVRKKDVLVEPHLNLGLSFGAPTAAVALRQRGYILRKLALNELNRSVVHDQELLVLVLGKVVTIQSGFDGVPHPCLRLRFSMTFELNTCRRIFWQLKLKVEYVITWLNSRLERVA